MRLVSPMIKDDIYGCERDLDLADRNVCKTGRAAHPLLRHCVTSAHDSVSPGTLRTV